MFRRSSALRRALLASLPALVVIRPVPLRASPISDFQARLAQTSWSLQQMESLLRAQPQSTVPVATPEAVASYLTLVSENVSALGALTAEPVTDEQRRVMADGLKSIVSTLKDEISLANNRGLTAIASALGALETGCRGALGSS